MGTLFVNEANRKRYEMGYNGQIEQGILFSESEDIIYKCMCFEITTDIYWQRLILTNKKIIRLWKNQVRFIYLKSIASINLECVNSNNVDRYIESSKLEECLQQGQTPYYLYVDGYAILLNNATDAMTLVDEINRLICE